VRIGTRLVGLDASAAGRSADPSGRLLDVSTKSDNLSDMRKTVSVAEFTKQFGPITNDLVPGESVQVTSYGKVHGHYVREGTPRRRSKIDLGKRLAEEDYSPEVGQHLINAILLEA
jgi:hypothetical protein